MKKGVSFVWDETCLKAFEDIKEYLIKPPYKHFIICNKNVNSGRCVVLADFDHLDLTLILKTSSLDHFVIIKD